MNRLGEAIRRQQAVQRSRTLAWALFSVFVPVSLLFWFESIFAFGHLNEVGILQLAAEFLLALFFSVAAVQMFRAGMRFNRLLADPARFLESNRENENLAASTWSAILPFSFWAD